MLNQFDLIGDRAWIGQNSFIEIKALNQVQRINNLWLIVGWVVFGANLPFIYSFNQNFHFFQRTNQVFSQ